MVKYKNYIKTKDGLEKKLRRNVSFLFSLGCLIFQKKFRILLEYKYFSKQGSIFISSENANFK